MLDRTIAPRVKEINDVTLPDFNIISLNNSVDCLIVNAGIQPVVMLELTLNSGRWYERLAGESYFAAKMIYQGTKDMSAEEVAQAFEETGSHVEITSGYDHVSIKLFAISRFFEHAARLLFRLIREASFDSEEFELMKSIRKQNLKLQLDRPDQYAHLRFSDLLFGENHPYGRILTPESIDAVTVDHAQDYFQNNLLADPKIILAGKVTDQEVALVEELIQGIEQRQSESLSYPFEEQAGQHVVEKNVNQISLRWGAMTIPKTHPDIHRLSIANTLFGGFFGSRLSKNIREEKGLTYGIYSSMIHMKSTSYWQISSELQAGNIEFALKEIEAEIHRLSHKAPEQEELETVRNYKRGKLLSSMSSPFNIAEQYKALMLSELDKQHYRKYIETLDKIEVNDIPEIFSEYFNRPSVVMYVK